jgi:hypothetical protein
MVGGERWKGDMTRSMTGRHMAEDERVRYRGRMMIGLGNNEWRKGVR